MKPHWIGLALLGSLLPLVAMADDGVYVLRISHTGQEEPAAGEKKPPEQPMDSTRLWIKLDTPFALETLANERDIKISGVLRKEADGSLMLCEAMYSTEYLKEGEQSLREIGIHLKMTLGKPFSFGGISYGKPVVRNGRNTFVSYEETLSIELENTPEAKEDVRFHSKLKVPMNEQYSSEYGPPIPTPAGKR